MYLSLIGLGLIIMNRELFVCDCGDVEHQFVVSSMPEEDEIYIAIHLSPNIHYWFERLWYAILYVLGKQSKYGAFGEIVLGKAETNRLIEALSIKLIEQEAG